jgi:hypothetical protein
MFVSAAIFGCAVPHSIMLYPMIWADPCSDAFFMNFEMAMTWIASLNALEGSAAVALGYLDYKVKTGNPDDLIVAMRKKRLAFAKFSFFMAITGLMLLDTPSANCVLPFMIGSGWNAMKIGTQIGFNMTPERFYVPRTFLSIYNLLFLMLIWYKLRQAR